MFPRHSSFERPVKEGTDHTNDKIPVGCHTFRATDHAKSYGRDFSGELAWLIRSSTSARLTSISIVCKR